MPVRIVDRLPEPTTESRAIIVHACSLEMFERLGLVDELIRAGVVTIAMEMHSDGEVVARTGSHSTWWTARSRTR
ncbi:2-polyprenyl-6-methoxyphenol hydroxylase-like FAD-dependent oxidoreductase [Streptomyces aurantiacus]|uniref:FAD-dependent monooxygenase n=1 Tax=Streptomyces aurantiacus TaxID=47760 RepID=UPI002791BC9C|nr:FAD-dependent monooxygenase [Streptomyces aurantiacus]MDQ0771685.1 2-polyprenyl-6-methoxyphenol hydroxylase-like FAD-dependent oxidoreductase [Streptomyces aurantiacus]